MKEANTIRGNSIPILSPTFRPKNLMYRFGFIVEQALGHITHGKNLQQNIEQDADVEVIWGLPGWEADGLAGRIGNWTVKAGLQTRQAVRSMQREHKMDALLFHTQVTAILAQDWMDKIPSVVSLDATPLQYDSLGEFYEHEPGTGSAEKLKYWLNKRCYDRAKHLITWSDWAKDSLVADYDIPAEKVTTISPGVNICEWQRPEPRQSAEIVRVLFVGGNLDRKGGTLLLEAIRQLRDENYPVELHLVTRDQVEAQPDVHVYNNMQPNSAELKALYHECDIFCLPTYGDCLPMVLAEAGAAGMPIVSTDVAGIPSIVHDGKTGFLVPRGSVESIVESLRQLLDDTQLRQEMGQAATDLIVAEHDAEQNAQRIIQIMKQVADE